jgi:hypothetical protein
VLNIIAGTRAIVFVALWFWTQELHQPLLLRPCAILIVLCDAPDLMMLNMNELWHAKTVSYELDSEPVLGLEVHFGYCKTSEVRSDRNGAPVSRAFDSSIFSILFSFFSFS